MEASASGQELAGRIETADSADVEGLTVEVWRVDWPADVVPVDVPLSRLDGVPAAVYDDLTSALVGRARAGADGTFTVDAVPTDLTHGRGGTVFVRVFDGARYVASGERSIAAGAGRPELVLDAGFVTKRKVGTAAIAATAVASSAVVIASFLGVTPDVPLPGDDDREESGPAPKPATPDEPEFRPEELSDQDRSGPSARYPGQVAESLYAGDDPVQTGVEDGAVETGTASILRGRVIARDGSPLSGVTVSVADHPEFGETTTRETGLFDMAVEGGNRYVLRYEREGYLPAQRTARVSVREFDPMPEVALVERSGDPTEVRTNADEVQVVRAPTSSDGDGERRPTLVVMPETAPMVSGSVPDRMSVRATEYTVGENGPQAMPERLPRNTGYTYAVELTAELPSGSAGSDDNGGSGGGPDVDRPVIEDARGDVQFNRPIVHYVENFLDFPVGGAVPSGFLSRSSAAWRGETDGRVVRVVEDGGGVGLDVDGSGQPADDATRQQLGITDAELDAVADLYDAGTTLWRSPVRHFTPWDKNWPVAFPDDAEAPPLPRDIFEDVGTTDPPPDTPEPTPTPTPTPTPVEEDSDEEDDCK